MNKSSVIPIAISSMCLLMPIQHATAATIFADTVLDYYDSGTGPMVGPYGGTYPGNVGIDYPVPVPLSYATDGSNNTFVTLPTDSYLTLGFSGGAYVFDGPGLDIFVSEIGGNDEEADIFVSADFGISFTLLGTATTATVSGFDLASIGFLGNVNAVKILGLDTGGGSPGFDLAFVQGLEGSSQAPTIPEPGILALLALDALPLSSIRSQGRQKS